MNTEPLKLYFKSVEAFKSGQKKEAASLLADSLGIAEITPFMKANLPKMLDHNDAILTILIGRTIHD